MKRYSFLLMMLVLSLTAAILGNLPRTLSYQGVLADAAGNRVPDGSYQLTISLYPQPAGGTALWQESLGAVVRDGVFSVILGKITPLNLHFDNSYWLGVKVNSGAEMTPRSELTAGAYALNAAAIADSIVSGAKVADGHLVRSLNGLRDDVNITAGANVTITPQGNDLVIGSTGGSGNSPWGAAGNDIYYNLGKVGVGTANPQTALDINGSLHLPATTAGGAVGVLLADSSRFLHNYGSDNLFAGKNAGNFTMTGAGNTALGADALTSNANGRNNTAVGKSALELTSSGPFTPNDNTAIGADAMKSNLIGYDNTAVGSDALFNNDIGRDNTAVGKDALSANTRGDNNTAIGSGANVSLGYLSNATAIGAGATVDNNNKIRLGNDQVSLVETAGTVSAAAFLGDGSGLSNIPTSRWGFTGSSLFFDNGNVAIGRQDAGIFPGAGRYLTLSATDFYSHKMAALELQGASVNGTIPVARIDFSSVFPSGISNNIARIHAEWGTNTTQGELVFFSSDGSSLNEALRIDEVGNVGIGTSAPATRLDVNGNISATQLDVNGNIAANKLALNRNSNATMLEVNHMGLLTNPLVHIETSGNPPLSTDLLQIRAGAGIASQAQFIECERGTDIEFRVNGDGNVTADGTFTGGGADFAEMMAVSDGASTVAAGDVLVIDVTNPRSIVKSRAARSTLVAGIYSSKPGFLGSERDWDRPAGDEARTYTMADMAGEYNEIPMAVVGIVPCKVSAENGAIRPGDLLVTATLPGHAMRDENPKNGTVLGKALEALTVGTGVIKVLVTLQ